MTLLDAILHRVKISSIDVHDKKYASPPPEKDEEQIIHTKARKKDKYAHIHSRIDTAPPYYNDKVPYRHLQQCSRDLKSLYSKNVDLLMQIRKAQLNGGRVDCHWKREPLRPIQHYRDRVDFFKRVYNENLYMYWRLSNTKSRVSPTASLNCDWRRNRREIVNRALHAFVLFPPLPYEIMEDPAFATPLGVKRPRVYMTVGLRDCAVLGELCLELFTDICPATCRLFMELLDGDTLGYGYIGTCFFRKVPHLYWSGGDVTHNNGFGCYAQKGRAHPIGAENYHFPHSMPGLLSMRVTCDDELCGIFNITFKPLPQFDLHNVVFGRVIRPSLVYDTIRVLGSALNSHPLVEVRATRRFIGGRWISGAHNTRLPTQYGARHDLAKRNSKYAT